MDDWWGNNEKGFRMIGKSTINGQEYGAIVSYTHSTRNLNLQQAWMGTTDVTANSIVTYAYR